MNTTVSGPPRKRILLVDDDAAARESIKLLLSIDRHTVTEAANGHEALQLFTGSTYDLVITDYLMPGMLGDELVRNIRNIAPAQPIIMVSAFLEKLANSDKPADAVLGKPLSVDDLRRAMGTPKRRTTSHQTATLSRSELQDRASAVTGVLHEILRRKAPARTLSHWTEKK